MKKILLLTLVCLSLMFALSSCGGQVQSTNGMTTQPANQTEPSIHNHIIVVDKAVNATCTTTGLTEGKHCSECGEILVKQKVVAKKEHTESNWIVDQKATYQSTGKKHIECTDCGTVLKKETIPVLTPASEGLEFGLRSDGESYYVKSIGTCIDTNIVIPLTYDGLPVTSIANYAFHNCTSIYSVEIPDSVTKIGDYAFYNCTFMQMIKIPDSVTSIGNGAFKDCKSLENIDIPSSVTSIGDETFRNCTSLVSMVIPYGVTSIGERSLNDCTALTSVEIPNSVTTIGAYAFAGCKSLEGISIPKNVTTIANDVFSGCKSITAINIPYGVTSIGSAAFWSCTSLNQINIPSSVTSIAYWAFYGCTSLKRIEIPSSVKVIEGGLFQNCSSSLTIFCGAESRPSEWDSEWNKRTSDWGDWLNVVWGYKPE